MEFSRQEYWSGLPFLSPGDLPDPGIEPESPALQILHCLSLQRSLFYLWDAFKCFSSSGVMLCHYDIYVYVGWLKAHNGSSLSSLDLNIFSVCVCMCVLVAQLCLILCYPMDCSPTDFSVHGILQARILEWIAILFSRGTSQPRDWTLVSCLTGRFFTIWATGMSISGALQLVNFP